jgi:hypothetical protein
MSEKMVRKQRIMWDTPQAHHIPELFVSVALVIHSEAVLLLQCNVNTQARPTRCLQ